MVNYYGIGGGDGESDGYSSSGSYDGPSGGTMMKRSTKKRGASDAPKRSFKMVMGNGQEDGSYHAKSACAAAKKAATQHFKNGSRDIVVTLRDTTRGARTHNKIYKYKVARSNDKTVVSVKDTKTGMMKEIEYGYAYTIKSLR
jgi:hypothetical protein